MYTKHGNPQKKILGGGEDLWGEEQYHQQGIKIHFMESHTILSVCAEHVDLVIHFQIHLRQHVPTAWNGV